jgi:hypothetical protein
MDSTLKKIIPAPIITTACQPGADPPWADMIFFKFKIAAQVI